MFFLVLWWILKDFFLLKFKVMKYSYVEKIDFFIDWLKFLLIEEI